MPENNDFVSVLPSELTADILERLSPIDNMQASQVSSSWCSFIQGLRQKPNWHDSLKRDLLLHHQVEFADDDLGLSAFETYKYLTQKNHVNLSKLEIRLLNVIKEGSVDETREILSGADSETFTHIGFHSPLNYCIANCYNRIIVELVQGNTAFAASLIDKYLTIATLILTNKEKLYRGSELYCSPDGISPYDVIKAYSKIFNVIAQTIQGDSTGFHSEEFAPLHWGDDGNNNSFKNIIAQNVELTESARNLLGDGDYAEPIYVLFAYGFTNIIQRIITIPKTTTFYNNHIARLLNLSIEPNCEDDLFGQYIKQYIIMLCAHFERADVQFTLIKNGIVEDEDHLLIRMWQAGSCEVINNIENKNKLILSPQKIPFYVACRNALFLSYWLEIMFCGDNPIDLGEIERFEINNPGLKLGFSSMFRKILQTQNAQNIEKVLRRVLQTKSLKKLFGPQLFDLYYEFLYANNGETEDRHEKLHYENFSDRLKIIYQISKLEKQVFSYGRLYFDWIILVKGYRHALLYFFKISDLGINTSDAVLQSRIKRVEHQYIPQTISLLHGETVESPVSDEYIPKDVPMYHRPKTIQDILKEFKESSEIAYNKLVSDWLKNTSVSLGQKLNLVVSIAEENADEIVIDFLESRTQAAKRVIKLLSYINHDTDTQGSNAKTRIREMLKKIKGVERGYERALRDLRRQGDDSSILAINKFLSILERTEKYLNNFLSSENNNNARVMPR